MLIHRTFPALPASARRPARWLLVAATLLAVTRRAVAQQPTPTDSAATATTAAAPAPPATDSATADALRVEARFPSDHFIDGHTPIELALSRPLRAGDARLAIMVGSTDVTRLFERREDRLVYRASLLPLPSGEYDLTVYAVHGDDWAPLVSAPIKVLTPAGFEKAEVTPSLSMNNNGQLAERHPAGEPPPDRRTFQDFTFTGGMRSTHERSGWTLGTQMNLVGVSQRDQALRFAQRSDAPRLDLSDYLYDLRRHALDIALGQQSVGTNRHLISSFTSRGISGSIGTGPATLSLGMLNGTSIVGWDNFVGIKNPRHRVSTASLALELAPKRPGALHVDFSYVDGSLLPVTSFTQNAVTDAARSQGGGVQVAASTPSQRLRVAAGFSQSRFTNPHDPLLAGDSATVPVKPATKHARYAEASAVVLQNAKLGKTLTAGLTVGYHHERVDPLYRSITASPQADVVRHVFEGNGTLGALSIQGSYTRSNDNLGNVPSILKTLVRNTTAGAALPLAAPFHAKRALALWPTLSYNFSRGHQFGAGLPVNSGFDTSTVPNLVSTSHDATAQWQDARWHASYHFAYSVQDNRQPGRGQDQTAIANGVSAGMTLTRTVTAGLDLAEDQQHDLARGQRQTTQRLGLNLQWHPFASTSVSSDAAISRSWDSPRTQRSLGDDERLELAQTVPLWRHGTQQTHAQAVIRFARQNAQRIPFDTLSDPTVRRPRVRWTLTSGLNVLFF